MPKNKEQKKQILESIKDKIARSKAVIFSSDQGLNVKTVEKMRRELKQSGAEYLVAKKTLLQLATKELGGAEVLADLRGSIGVTLSYQDEVTGAKIVNKYAQESGVLELGSGILENKFILADMVKRLATLASREQLLAKLVGTLNAPLNGLVQVLGGNTRRLVYVLSAIKDKK